MEKSWLRTARLLVGAILVLESLAMLAFAMFFAMIGSLAGALAFLGGAGGATDKQVAQGFGIIALTIGSPFVFACLLVTCGTLLLLGKRAGTIVALGVGLLALQGLAHPFFRAELVPLEFVPAVLHLAAIALGLSLSPSPPAVAAAR